MGSLDLLRRTHLLHFTVLPTKTWPGPHVGGLKWTHIQPILVILKGLLYSNIHPNNDFSYGHTQYIESNQMKMVPYDRKKRTAVKVHIGVQQANCVTIAKDILESDMTTCKTMMDIHPTPPHR